MKRSAEAAFVVEQLPSPASSPAPSSSSECPPRKRSRSELTTEERKEARAHRNRIAAQNSRDRRKAQFSHLEVRVAELEEENRQLRAGMGLHNAHASSSAHHDSLARDNAREQENEELRARIKTLENGWDAVVKALAASGLPLNIPAPPTASPSSSDASTAASRVFTSVAPPTPASPTPSSSSSLFEFEDFEPTRHLARVAFTDAPLLSSVPQQRLRPLLNNSNLNSSSASAGAPTTIVIPAAGAPTSSAAAPIDESAMEDLFREILAPSPVLPPASLPANARLEEPAQVTAIPPAGASLDWEGEAEMQRLLDMLPDVQPDVNRRMELNAAVDFPSALDLDICAWDMGPSAASVGVF